MRALSFVVAASCACVSIAHAQNAPAPDGPPDIYRRIRELLADEKYAEARDLLEQAYELAPQPKVLFALGQVEFNLNNFQAAIDYYQRFLDSNPDPREAALAQQAIGAARARLVAPPPRVIEKEAPVPAYERDWDGWNTSLVALGGAAAISGAIVWVHGYRTGHDQSPTTQSEYRARLDRAKRWQWTGAGISAAGVLIATSALVRFAVHRVEVVPVTPSSSPGAVGLALVTPW